MQRQAASSLLRRLSTGTHCSTGSNSAAALDCLEWGQCRYGSSLASHAGRFSSSDDRRTCPAVSPASSMTTLADPKKGGACLFLDVLSDESTQEHLNGKSTPLAHRQRWYSSNELREADKFTYHGPLSQTLKNLKRLSISGAAASVFGTPILVINTADALPFAAQASICFTIASFGIFTTGLLHWFTSPYVHRLDFNRQSREGSATTLNVLSQSQIHHFRESEIVYPDTMRPQVTFEVKGKYFYLDANAFEDKELLTRLTPADPNAADSVSMPEAESKQ